MNDQQMPPALLGLEPAGPPERLRALTLGAAERGWGVRPDLWTRLWESRVARLAWAAVVLALVASHGLLSMSRPRPTTGALPATLARSGSAELEELAGVREIRIARFAWLTEGRSGGASSRPRRSTGRHEPQKESS